MDISLKPKPSKPRFFLILKNFSHRFVAFSEAVFYVCLLVFKPVVLLPCRRAKNQKKGENKMKKVVCSISKKNGTGKLKGVGYIAEDNLFIPAISKENNPYIRVIEDVTKYCHPIIGKDKEFSGIVPQAFENLPIFNKEKDRYETRDYIEIDYIVWYKYIG